MNLSTNATFFFHCDLLNNSLVFLSFSHPQLPFSSTPQLKALPSFNIWSLEQERSVVSSDYTSGKLSLFWIRTICWNKTYCLFHLYPFVLFVIILSFALLNCSTVPCTTEVFVKWMRTRQCISFFKALFLLFSPFFYVLSLPIRQAIDKIRNRPFVTFLYLYLNIFSA